MPGIFKESTDEKEIPLIFFLIVFVIIILNQTIKNIKTAGIALMQICYLLTQPISGRWGTEFGSIHAAKMAT